MAQPRAYTRQANFTDHTTESPSDPQVGSKLDSEFDALNLTPRAPAPPEAETPQGSPTPRENRWRTDFELGMVHPDPP